MLAALRQEDIRLDGRRPYEYRNLAISFGKVDGSSDVQLGDTRVMAFVSGQLVQPYMDRPSEGSLSIFTEFSPMADPSFEPGRPSEFAVEFGRIVDRGLRESRAVDTESLCVVAGKLVWSIHIDLHILDNGGNLLDASNIAALAALMTFRRPDCTMAGDDGHKVIVHPTEVREPLPLIVHHLPISVTFAIFDNADIVVVDPSHFEEAVMEGRLTATLNTNGDICAIQKRGVGVSQSVIMKCIRIAYVKAAETTEKIKNAVESFNAERMSSKINRHLSSVAVDVGVPGINFRVQKQFDFQMEAKELSQQQFERLNLNTEESCSSISFDKRCLQKARRYKFTGVASSWDPFSHGIDVESLKATMTSRGTTSPIQRGTTAKGVEADLTKKVSTTLKSPISSRAPIVEPKAKLEKTLKDAVKPKNMRNRSLLVPPS